jgi:hypothetical protein
MEDREKPYTDKNRKIMNDWNYDDSCMVTSLTVWDSENFRNLILVAEFTVCITLHH